MSPAPTTINGFKMCRIRVFSLLAVSTGMTGCSITQTVDPIEPARVSQVCILDDLQMLMNGFQPEVRRQIEAKHIPTKIYRGARPAECSHYVEYTANWQWDMAMYLTYAEFRVYDARGLTGSAFYDARDGGARLDKFGHTADKIRPLIDELFGSVSVGLVLVPAQTESATTPLFDRNTLLRELQELHAQKLITDEAFSARRQALVEGSEGK